MFLGCFKCIFIFFYLFFALFFSYLFILISHLKININAAITKLSAISSTVSNAKSKNSKINFFILKLPFLLLFIQKGHIAQLIFVILYLCRFCLCYFYLFAMEFCFARYVQFTNHLVHIFMHTAGAGPNMHPCIYLFIWNACCVY